MLEQSKRRLNIKLIESDTERCDELAENLNHTLIIQGNGTDLALMEDENVGEMDMFIAVTDDDKENLLACILAKFLGAKKTDVYKRQASGSGGERTYTFFGRYYQRRYEQYEHCQ